MAADNIDLDAEARVRGLRQLMTVIVIALGVGGALAVWPWVGPTTGCDPMRLILDLGMVGWLLIALGGLFSFVGMVSAPKGRRGGFGVVLLLAILEIPAVQILGFLSLSPSPGCPGPFG